MTTIDEIGIDRSRNQKLRNLQIKTACLENEEYIQELHITDYIQVQKSKLDAAHEKAEKLMRTVEAGTKWDLSQAYDLQKLIRVCSLQMNPKELNQPQDQAQFMGVIALRKTLQELKQHRNRNKVVSMTELLDKYIRRLDEAEQLLRRSQVDATEVSSIPAETVKMIEDCMNVSGATMAMANNDERIRQQHKLIERANEVQNIALADGEMSIAEEQYYTKIQLMEMLLELVNNKFAILDATQSDNIKFKDVTPVELKAHQAVAQMKDKKQKLKDKCQSDLDKLKNAMSTAEKEDADALKHYAETHKTCDGNLKGNLAKQAECWAKLQELEKQLQRLGTERFEEVKRLLEEFDKEQKRKVEYNQFLEIADAHKRALELTVFNCDVQLNLMNIAAEFATESTKHVMQRFLMTNDDIEDMRLQVCKEQLEAHRQLYITLGQLKYKKEKRLEEIDQQIRTSHIHLEFCIETFDANAKKHSDEKKDFYQKRTALEEELDMIVEKMNNLTNHFEPTARRLRDAGIEFLPPEQELAETNLHRRSKIVDYKLSLTEHEEEKILRERNELKKAILTRSPRSPVSSRLAGNSLSSPFASPTPTKRLPAPHTP